MQHHSAKSTETMKQHIWKYEIYNITKKVKNNTICTCLAISQTNFMRCILDFQQSWRNFHACRTIVSCVSFTIRVQHIHFESAVLTFLSSNFLTRRPRNVQHNIRTYRQKVRYFRFFFFFSVLIMTKLLVSYFFINRIWEHWYITLTTIYFVILEISRTVCSSIRTILYK